MGGAWDIPEEELSREDMAVIERFAEGVVDRRLATPVVLFLESVRPLNFVGSQLLYFLSPLIGWFVPRWELEAFGRVLEKRKAIGRILDEIEAREKERREKGNERREG